MKNKETLDSQSSRLKSLFPEIFEKYSGGQSSRQDLDQALDEILEREIKSFIKEGWTADELIELFQLVRPHDDSAWDELLLDHMDLIVGYCTPGYGYFHTK